MAASRFIEEESGSYTTRIRHPHNGYYAGDFSLVRAPLSSSTTGRWSAGGTVVSSVRTGTSLASR